ncbi:hypothetical protein BSKO_06944 [Bryopsis sp. KO-2023]|nr:hypothetical protein BSKO_06944 [Bryopsis sp. KO-2023]
MHSGAEQSCPRITADMMNDFVGRKVRFLGKMVDSTPGRLNLVGHDDTRVAVETNPSTKYEGPFIEVLGMVKEPGLLVESGHAEFGESVDLAISAEACKLARSTFDYLFTK